MPEANHQTCPSCGEPVTTAVVGLCPRCLLGNALGGETGSAGGFAFGDSDDSPAGRTTEALPISLEAHGRNPLSTDDAPPTVRQSPSEGPALADRFARLEFFGEIGRGGMGIVLRGRDPDLGRDLAVKVLRYDLRGHPEMTRRFVEEAQIGGQLQHPGVVPVYELGTLADRRPFFAMKLVKGQTLGALLAARKHPVSDLARFLDIVESISQTVAYAHARGVIHRDLKPSNIMIGSFGEVQVMDWGLAKVLPRGGASEDAGAGRPGRDETLIATVRSGADDSDRSHAGSVLGTPSYMAPEQARGEIERVDERADVFALGSILCEILTGQPAFIGRYPREIQRRAASGDTADALGRLDGCGADPELVALARDCLAREPEDRPREAGIVSGRVTAYLAGVQQRLRSAERERAVTEARAVEERRRRKLQAGLAAAMLALVGLGGAGAWASARQSADRIAATTRVVDDALGKASDLRGRAYAAPVGDLSGWREASAQVKRAEDALDQGTADEVVRRRVAELRARIDGERAAAAEKAHRLDVDHVLLADLESARAGRAEQGDPARADASYAAAFRKAGLDLDRADPAESGRWLAARSEPVELAGYLDDWAIWRMRADRPEANWRRLVAASRGADPDPWRDAVRARVAAKDAAASAEIRRLADDDKALETQPAPSLILLARQLKGLNDSERAARVLRRAVLRHPADYWAHYELGLVRGTQGSTSDSFPMPEEAVRHLTAALAIRPRSRMASGRLSFALLAQGKEDEAAAVCREAVRRDPADAMAHSFLGFNLLEQGKLDDAIAELREALRYDPDFARAHFFLAHTLWDKGERDEAAAEYRRAIKIDPQPIIHTTLGKLLQEQGKLDEAVSEHREALRVNPNLVPAHHNLSFVLLSQGKLTEAIAAERGALRIKPDWAPGLLRLGLLLRVSGDYAGSLAAYRRGHELGSKQPTWSEPSAEAVADAELLVALAGRLSALLSGDDRPRDNAERLALAQLGYDTRQFALAVRLFSEALRADPKLADDRRGQRRYYAARAAALAAAGKGMEGPPPGDTAKVKLRDQALDYLRAERDAWTRLLESGRPEDRTTALKNLRQWGVESDLAGVRDTDELAKLPEAERKQWQSLWADVDALLKKAAPARP